MYHILETHFRLFVIFWAQGNLALYSWAGEKMPWLSIHITMPTMLLAAIGLEPVVRRCSVQVMGVKNGRWSSIDKRNRVQSSQRMPSIGRTITASVLTIFLFVLTLQNMFQLSFVHYADGPHEMMIYVQTTKDVHVVMGKIATLDQKMHGGQHKLSIGVMSDAEWPFYWYLRDYTNVCYGFPTGGLDANPEVIIVGGDDEASWL